jgi:RNA polymerase sigma factor (sigma-70 family)
MRERQLVRLFRQFRERKDGHALARIFDAKARELLGVAVHLVRDAQEAEDLVQATFLAAMERADSFDDGEPLSPWLFGILFREACKTRRRNARVLEQDRLVTRTPEDPLQQAAAREVPLILDKALRRCPGRYREVLEPMLRDGRRPDEIAQELGRSPGTVRMQIHRGLEHLRRLLPAGLGAGAAVSFLPTRGLAAVRGEVLRTAGITPVSVAPLPIGILSLGMSKSLLAVPAAFVLLTVGWYFAREPAKSTLVAAGRGAINSQALEDPPLQEEQERKQRAAVGAASGDARSDTTSGNGAVARAMVLVQVVDNSERPVPEALVLTGSSTEAGLTDLEGRLAVRLEQDSMEVHARASGHAPSLWRRVRAVDGPRQELVLTLPSLGATLDITVVDESDQPVADAIVTVGDRQLNVLLADGEIARTPPARSVTTDVAGQATVSELTPREHLLRVSAPGYRPAYRRAVVLVAGERKELTLWLERGWAMEGRVVDAAGAPVAGASVGARHSDVLHDPGGVSTTTDEDGRYLLRGISYSPSFRAVASKGHEGRAEELVEVLPDATLVWNPVLVHGDEVRGRVLDARGEPLEGWYVLLHKPDTPGLWHRRALTDEGGHFHISTTPDWRFHLSVRTPRLWDGGSIVERDDVHAGDVGVVIRVPKGALPTASIAGRLRYRSGGVPPSPGLRYEKEGESIAWGAEADPTTGVFQIDSLRPGRYRLLVTPTGLIYEELEHILEVGPEETLELGDVVLEDPGVLVPSLSCPDDPPRGTLDFHLVRLRGEGRRCSTSFSGAPPSHLALLPGHYELAVKASHYRKATLSFDIRSDTQTPLTIELVLATELSVHFLSEEGADPIRSVEFVVSVMNTDTVVTRHVVQAGQDGQLTLEFDLDPGSYRFSATSDDGRQTGTSLWWNSMWTEDSIDLVLKRP